MPITLHRHLLAFENSNTISFHLLTFILKPQQGGGSFVVNQIRGTPDVLFHFRLHFSSAKSPKVQPVILRDSETYLVTHTLQTPDSSDPHLSLPACWRVAPILGGCIVREST